MSERVTLRIIAQIRYNKSVVNKDKDIFIVDRASALTMTDQLVASIRGAITGGRLSAGDILPPVKKIAEMSGACEMVVRGAIRRLTAEGLVRSRRHVGCMVCPQGSNAWRGYVLIVSKQMGTYHYDMQATLLRERLTREGFFVSQTFVFWRDDKPDFAQLDEALAHPFSLVVVLTDGWGVADHVRRKGVRCLFAKDVLRVDYVPARSEMVKKCVRAKVRRAGCLCMCRHPNALVDAFLSAGIAIKYLYVHPNESNNGIEEAELGALRLFERLLSKGKRNLPEFIYSEDDYLTRGMLTAFAHHHVRVPEDVRVVTFSNCGNGPWYFKSLARIEIDPLLLGKRLADRAIRMLDGKPLLAPLVHSARYIDGETFP